MPKPMRVRKGKPLGLYGQANDFLNYIRKPGDDDSPIATEQKVMDEEQRSMSEDMKGKRKRRMNIGGIYSS